METKTALEQNINKILTDLSKQFKNFYQTFEKELSVQKEVCGTIWESVQRFKILKKGQDRLKRKDDDLSDIIEAEMLTAVNREIRKVHQSNKTIELMLTELKTAVEIFLEEVKKVDSSCTTSFLEGDVKRKPIRFYSEMISDLFMSLSNTTSQMRCLATLLEESDLEALEKYQRLLDPSDQFKNYFHTNLSYLTHL